jgi:predicted ester cyclase
MVVDHVIESDDEIVVLGKFRGTHTGDLQGEAGTIPASGNQLDVRYIEYFKVVDGRIVGQQTIFDQMEFLSQLGALPQS